MSKRARTPDMRLLDAAPASHDQFEGAVIDAVSVRLRHKRCAKCGTDNIEIVWSAEKPEVVRTECKDCDWKVEEPAR
jgi:hypothetical protein